MKWIVHSNVNSIVISLLALMHYRYKVVLENQNHSINNTEYTTLYTFLQNFTISNNIYLFDLSVNMDLHDTYKGDQLYEFAALLLENMIDVTKTPTIKDTENFTHTIIGYEAQLVPLDRASLVRGIMVLNPPDLPGYLDIIKQKVIDYNMYKSEKDITYNKNGLGLLALFSYILGAALVRS